MNYHVSVGGLDSIVLYLFLHEICDIDAPGVSASYLEDKSIQRVHKALGIINVPPLKREDGTSWSKPKVIQEFGFPVISKEVAAKIELLQNPTEKNNRAVCDAGQYYTGNLWNHRETTGRNTVYHQGTAYRMLHVRLRYSQRKKTTPIRPVV